MFSSMKLIESTVNCLKITQSTVKANIFLQEKTVYKTSLNQFNEANDDDILK